MPTVDISPPLLSGRIITNTEVMMGDFVENEPGNTAICIIFRSCCSFIECKRSKSSDVCF